MTAILILAIGIGVNTVAFTAINSLLTKPRSLPHAEELGWIQVKAPGNPYGSASLPDFQEFAQQNRAFAAIVAEGRMPLAMGNGSATETVSTLLVSGDYLGMLGARARAGRIFTRDDVRGPDLPVVVSERFWNERLGGGESVAGRTVVFNNRVFSIVGVLRDGFQGPGGLYEPQVWLPLEQLDLLDLTPALRSRDRAWLSLFGRMKPGVTPVDAEADLQAIAEQLAAAYPATNKDVRVTFRSMTGPHPLISSLAPAFWIAQSVVGVVLLIACFNVAGLLLARAAERRREISIRSALGATRARILRYFLAEGLLLAALSGLAALLIARWSGDLLAAFSLPSPIPQRLHMRVDWRLVGYTALLASLAGLLPAILPALQATRGNLLSGLKAEPMFGGRPSRTRNALVVVQIAGSTMFLAAALLFVRAFWNLATFDRGFDVAHVLTVEVTPATYGYGAARAAALAERALQQLSRTPGVQHAAVADLAPFAVGFPTRIEIPGRGEDCAVVTCRAAFEIAVGRGNFAALGLPLVEGRDFTDDEIRSGSAAIVNTTMAAQLWPGQGAIGQWLRGARGAPPRQVVGVAADVQQRATIDRTSWQLYRPLRKDEFSNRITFVLRTAGDPSRAVPATQQVFQSLDSHLPAHIRTMEQRMEVPLWPARTAAGSLLVCGALALILASVGLFGVTFYGVTQRMREFGIRIALGATRARVLALVLKDGLLLTVTGVLLGAGAAFIAVRLASTALFGVIAADPIAFAITALLQMIVALAATSLPALQATRSDPLLALRAE